MPSTEWTGPFSLSRPITRGSEKSGSREKATARWYDPDRWFNNVEMAAAKEIGRETVHYVSSIYKYYVACQLVLEQKRLREEKKPKH